MKILLGVMVLIEAVVMVGGLILGLVVLGDIYRSRPKGDRQ